MAAENSGMDIEQFTCGICMENYNTPRCLPTCDHTFCKRCLLTYARNVPKLGDNPECPVCGKPYQLAEKNHERYGIIKLKESESETHERGNIGADNVQRKCDPCRERGETVAGLKFCMDCQEVYCKTCTESHKVLKMSKHHKLIDTGKMPTKISCSDFLTSFTKCPNHPETEAEFFCNDHNVVFCVVCFNSTHKLCDTCIVSNYGNDAAKLREESEELTSRMRNAVNHLNLLKTITGENKKKLKEVNESVEQVRDQVITLMDNVVRHIADVTKQIELENEDTIDENLSRISTIKELVEEKVALLSTIRHHGSERHQFISTHVMKSQIEEIGRKIAEEDKRLKIFDAVLTVAEDIRKLLKNTNLDKLAQMMLNKFESSHKHLCDISSILRDKQLVRVEEHIICANAENISGLKGYPVANVPYYNGVSMHKDGRVILSDTNRKYMCLYNPANKILLELNLDYPYSTTQIDDTHIAVSIPKDKAISIVTIGDELRVEKTFKTQYKPGGIVALNNGQLAVAWRDPPAFGIIDISGAEIVQKSYFEQDKRGRKMRSFDYLAVDEKRHHVIQPSYMDNTVYCFDFTGEPVFVYTDPGQKSLRGVALDKCGNIYVCENRMDSIHKLSPAGELIAIFTEGVPRFLLAICCDNTDAGFWVTHSQSTDHIYTELQKKLPTFCFIPT